MSSFERQVKRASQRNEMDLVKETVDAMDTRIEQLDNENKALFRTIGALVQVSGGEIRLPPEEARNEIIKGKRLTTFLDDATGELVFKVEDLPSTND